MKEHEAKDGAFLSIDACRRTRYYYALRSYHHAHHAAA